MKHWQQALQQGWNIQAELTRLDGEYDLNILAETAAAAYVLKVMRPGCDPALIEMQISAMTHLAQHAPALPIPAILPAILPGTNGAQILTLPDEAGQDRLCWLLEKRPGHCYAQHSPKSPALITDVGRITGQCDAALAEFTHPELRRDFKWDLMRGDWIDAHLTAIQDATRQQILRDILDEFAAIRDQLAQLPQQAIHNDINDYNILVTGGVEQSHHISGLIDFGDMCAAPRICNLAIAAAYVVLDHPSPEQALAALVQGYHHANPLRPAELDLLYPLLRMRLAVSVVNSTLEAADNPDDPYVTISQAPAWRFLQAGVEDPGLLRARLRTACGLPVTGAAERISEYLQAQTGNFAPILGRDLSEVPMGSLSVEQSAEPQNPFDLPLAEAAQLGAGHGDAEGWWLGYYNEPRLIYTADAFRKGPWKASNRRTVHLAVDVFAPAATPVATPLAATVHVVENRMGHLDYGGVVILQHQTPDGDLFYSLYGHLAAEVADQLTPGQQLAKGEIFATLGNPTENGGWAPHLHLQLALSTDGMGQDWPGVADPDELYLWHALCPNPAPLLNLPAAKVHYQATDKAEILAGRQAHFGGNLSLTYSDPVMLLRGWKHHLFDEWGRPYLDAYNNVPHVGHAHPRIQAVAADQLQRMNSNTRYLHPAQVAFAEKILSKLPDHLQVCFFVNSGTEANELALRLARAHTGAKGMVTPDHGYHGNTTGVIDISAYKFNAKGGVGQSDWVELVAVADDYRGRFDRADPERAQKFAALVEPAITALQDRGHGVAGVIAETFPSVGGQIIPPPGYLPAVYEKIRAAGGICIADEVQTGLGRLGDYYFGFEHQGALPDVVVLGKPIGNGHPLGVLVTTREIADSFAKGPEFFSTFGGSTLSCRIGKEVLDIVDDEGLQQNAKIMGDRLLAGLLALEAKYEVVGDIRGMGLFIGVELITDAASRTEATAVAQYVKNRMRDHRILLGSEGPKDNILKIRPPLSIDAEGIDMILQSLDQILNEV